MECAGLGTRIATILQLQHISSAAINTIQCAHSLTQHSASLPLPTCCSPSPTPGTYHHWPPLPAASSAASFFASLPHRPPKPPPLPLPPPAAAADAGRFLLARAASAAAAASCCCCSCWRYCRMLQCTVAGVSSSAAGCNCRLNAAAAAAGGGDVPAASASAAAAAAASSVLSCRCCAAPSCGGTAARKFLPAAIHLQQQRSGVTAPSLSRKTTAAQPAGLPGCIAGMQRHKHVCADVIIAYSTNSLLFQTLPHAQKMVCSNALCAETSMRPTCRAAGP